MIIVINCHYSVNCPIVFVTMLLLAFERDATSEAMAPGSIFHQYKNSYNCTFTFFYFLAALPYQYLLLIL